MKRILILCFLSTLHLTMADYSYSQQPEYQVSIVLKMPGSYGTPIHLCNGVIIFERLILTTADCLLFKFGPDTKPNQLDASVLSILAGSSNAKIDTLQMNVSSIKMADNFDPVTLENDLAVLTLSEALPLGTRPDIKWIMLDDNSHINRSCVVNFFSRNTRDAIPDYYQTEEVYMIKNGVCRNSTKYPTARKRDICSSYVLPHRFNCAKTNSFLSLNNDRGSGLVCKSYLVGLLSSVVTRPNPATNCSEVNLRAMYTNISPHSMWIYGIMATIETEYISTPYDASLNPLVLSPSPSANFTTPINTTTADNSTYTNSEYPFVNLTIAEHLPVNSSILNSTLTNSTFVNSTELNYATPHPLPLNGTRWNTTLTNKNHTVKPATHHYGHGVSTVPMQVLGGSSSDHYRPPPPPPVQNIFKTSGAMAGLRAEYLLIALLYLALIGFYL